MLISLINVSDSLVAVLKKIETTTYTQQISILDNQTIGMQVRHIIEHWQILLENYNNKKINYANRNRNKEIENNIDFAIQLIKQFQQQSNKKDCRLTIISTEESYNTTSTYYRELEVVTEHFIHHAAIIKMAILFKQPTFIFPIYFGYAPSTITFKLQQCVQ